MFTSRTKAPAIVACATAILLSLLAFADAPARDASVPPEDATPTAEKILDRFVEALGGVKAFDKLRSTVTAATLAIPAAGVAIDVTIYAARPNLFYSIAESPMIGKIERGTDGAIFWEKSTMQGPRVLEGEELADAMRDAKFEGLSYWRSIYDSVAVAGLDTVDGSPGYKVVLKPKGGKPRTYVFDVISGLLVKTIHVAATQMGEIPVVGYVSDYRKTGDILQSYATTMKIMGQDRIITIANVEQNAAIPDSVFALPADIKELLETAKEEKKE